MNVLVTGADGFIGKHLVKGLRKTPINVFTIDSTTNMTNQFNVVTKVSEANPDVIIHLAAEVGVAKWNKDDGSLLLNNMLVDSNLKYAISLLEKTPRVMYASTSELYESYMQMKEDNLHHYRIDEHPRSKYGAVKYLGEALFDDINLRFFNVVGAGQSREFGLQRMIDAARTDKPINASRCTRAFISIDDVVPWLISIVQDIENVPKGALNIGNPSNCTHMVTAAEMIKEATHSESEIVEYDDDWNKDRCPVIDKASKYWNPAISFSSIIKQLVDEVSQG